MADSESDAVVYLYGAGKRFAAIAFVGRGAKPRWRYSFGDEAQRGAEIDRLFEERRRVAAARAQRAARHTLSVGDVLDCAWGYEQTNVEFYQVIRVLAASVEMRPIASAKVEASASAMRGTCTPVPDRFIGPPRLYRADGTNSVVIRKDARATPWNGRPRHWSSYG